MKIIHQNLRQGEVKVLVENLDDLWYLSQIIDATDRVHGKTVRKIKVTEEADASKRFIFLAIVVESVEYAKTTSQLRVSGKVIEGSEDVPHGSYHTFAVEPGAIITIIKQQWHTYQLIRLKEASQLTLPKILVCVFDREEAFFALLQREGHQLLGKIKGDVAKKAIDEKTKGGFYEAIIKQLQEYDQRYTLDKIILASPAFWKDELVKVLTQPELKKKIIFATCSSVDETAIHEVLKREETKQALQQERTSQETRTVEQLLAEIAKQGLAAYGLAEVEHAASAGAIAMLLVTDGLIQKTRQGNTFQRLELVMRIAEQTKAELVIVSSNHDGGKKLDGLGGIGAILRYRTV